MKSTESNPALLGLMELMEVISVQRLLNDFCTLLGCHVVVLDREEQVILDVGPGDVCSSIACPHAGERPLCSSVVQKLTYQSETLQTIPVTICERGLRSAEMPFVYKGEEFLRIHMVRFLGNENDREVFRLNLDKSITGTLEGENMVQNLPVFSERRLSNILEYLLGMSEVMLKLGKSAMERKAKEDQIQERAIQLEMANRELEIQKAEAIQHVNEAMKAREGLEFSRLALQESEKHYRTLVDNLPAVVYRCELQPPWYMFYVSDYIRQLTAYEPEDFYKGGLISYADIVLPDDLHIVNEEIENALMESRIYEMEYRIRDKNGTVHWVFERGRFVLSEDKHPLYLDGVITDITREKEHQAQLRQAFEERKVLIREIHHRVKNNLAAIIHLIEKQIELLPDEKSRQFLQVLKLQAYTMALIYDQLNQTKKLSKIEMSHYFEELSQNIAASLNKMDWLLTTVECEEIWMDVNLATPCALIVNELMTNAYKYAFAESHIGDRHLLIKLNFSENTYHLIVRDNGIGLPADFNINDLKSSGMQLVRLWAEHQLGGTFNVQSDNGVYVEIKFKDRKKSENISFEND